MTNEQREAIEIIEKMIKSYMEADECGLSNNDFKYEIGAMQTVLNMLKEKDELYHKALTDLVKADRENIQIKKQIDLMAEYIANRDNDEDICRHQVAEWCKDEEGGVLVEVCKKCIKQYFAESASRSDGRATDS